MKGYSKGCGFKTSADKHFAEGGKVRAPIVRKKAATQSKNDFVPGGNKEANIRDGFSPNLPKAARDDIEKRFGKNPPVKKAMGGMIGKVNGDQGTMSPNPRGGGILGRVAAKLHPLGTSPKAPTADPRASLPRPAPAANARSVPGRDAKPMFGRGAR
jgi:hypothetical protein